VFHELAVLVPFLVEFLDVLFQLLLHVKLFLAGFASFVADILELGPLPIRLVPGLFRLGDRLLQLRLLGACKLLEVGFCIAQSLL